MSKTTGTVKFFLAEKGYGFIWPSSEMSKDENIPKNTEGAREEIFFHVTAVLPFENEDITLASGDEVDFEVAEAENGRGQNAVNIGRTRSAHAKNRTSLPVTSASIGVPKADLPALLSLIGDFTKGANAAQLQPQELDTLKRHLFTLQNVERKMNHPAGVSKKNSKASTAAHQ